jgi:D-alanyl-D-alanine dipeptidase
MALANFKVGKIGEKFFSTSFILFLAFIFNCCAPQPSRIPLNKYGLKVVKWKTTYKQLTTSDSSKKLVLVSLFVSPLQTDWVYATKNNFTHQILYKHPRAYLRLPAALALQKVTDTLSKMGYGIKIFDAYRPYSVTKKMWKIVPDDNYAADPAKGSGHNRGIAIDLTLVDLSTGKELAMPTTFDNFSDTAHHSFMNLSSSVLQNRALLKTTMEKYGFVALPTEWWHYSLPNPKNYNLLDLDFDKLYEILNHEGSK